MIQRFGKLITVSFIVMGIGLVALLSTPVWLQFGIDTDLPGLFIILVGLELFLIGVIRRKNLGKVKLTALFAILSVLSIVILIFIVGFIFPDFNFH